jgi:glycosyltransferase involved in cell wall biosynthesis
MSSVSFVIPAYNEERRISACVSSIRKELSAHPQVEGEIIVVNNASTDRTRETAAAIPGVRLIDEPRKGVVRARQRGLEEAKYELVAHIDADNEVMPGWLPFMLAEFKKDPQLVCLSGPYSYFDVPPHIRLTSNIFYRIAFVFGSLLTLMTGKGTVVMGGNYVVRKEAVLRTGGYDTSIVFYGDDTDVSRRLSAAGRVRFRFGLNVSSSGRRLMEHGVLRTGFTYVINYFWVLFFKHPRHSAPTELTNR